MVMIGNGKVQPFYNIKDKGGQYSKKEFYMNNGESMPRQTWKFSVESVSTKEHKNGRDSYTVRNDDAFTIDRHINNTDGPKMPQENNAVDSSLKNRWKSGNILIILLPLGSGLLPAAFLIGAYFHADNFDLLRLKNNTDVPYISDVGNYTPHSSVFTFGLSMSALFGMWLITVRYLQVKCLYHNTGSKANFCSLIAGYLGILGELIVGSFQLSSHFTLHYLGAFLHFVAIMIFMGLQTFITHRNINNEGKRKYAVALVIVRGLLSSGLLMCLVVFGVFLLPSLSKYNRKGYSVAQGAEWAMLVSVVLFMLTFLYEFIDLTCTVVVADFKTINANPTPERYVAANRQATD